VSLFRKVPPSPRPLSVRNLPNDKIGEVPLASYILLLSRGTHCRIVYVILIARLGHDLCYFTFFVYKIAVSRHTCYRCYHSAVHVWMILFFYRTALSAQQKPPTINGTRKNPLARKKTPTRHTTSTTTNNSIIKTTQ
jgi:hypothetical protein